MFTAEQYRAKAAQYDGFLAAAQSPAEIAEYRGLRQSYALHADNLDWLVANGGKTVISDPHDSPFRRRRGPDAADAEQENILHLAGNSHYKFIRQDVIEAFNVDGHFHGLMSAAEDYTADRADVAVIASPTDSDVLLADEKVVGGVDIDPADPLAIK